MDAITYSTARKHLVETMERVCNDHVPVIITRQNARSVVIMSLEDYNAIEETAYLSRSSANAQRLRESIGQYEQGKFQARNLLEP
jgi:antitoxin YefM